MTTQTKNKTLTSLTKISRISTEKKRSQLFAFSINKLQACMEGFILSAVPDEKPSRTHVITPSTYAQ